MLLSLFLFCPGLLFVGTKVNPHYESGCGQGLASALGLSPAGNRSEKRRGAGTGTGTGTTVNGTFGYGHKVPAAAQTLVESGLRLPVVLSAYLLFLNFVAESRGRAYAILIP